MRKKKVRVISEYKFQVIDKEEKKKTIYAKILKEGDFYYWYISHIFKPSPAAGYYRPSNSEREFASAESNLLAYVASFTKDFIYNELYE